MAWDIAYSPYVIDKGVAPNAGNLVSAGVAPSLSSGSGQIAIRWYPGHYMYLNSIGASTASIVAQIAALRSNTSVRGVILRKRWSELEGATQGDYTAGKTMLQALIDECNNPAHAIKRKIWLMPEYVLFGGSDSPAPTNLVPAYISADSTNLGQSRMQAAGWMANVWRAAVMDAYLALHASYGADFAGNNVLAGVQNGKETTQNATLFPADYSVSAFATQYKRETAGLRASWPQLMVNAHTNFQASEEVGYFNQCITSRAGPGGPDVLPAGAITYPGYGGSTNLLGGTDSARVYFGNQNSSGTQGAGIGTNYRGVLPYLSHIQAAAFNGSHDNFLPSEIYDYTKNTLLQHYMFWAQMDGTTVSTYERTDMSLAAYKTAVDWDTGILPFLDANPTTYTGPIPTALGATTTAGS